MPARRRRVRRALHARARRHHRAADGRRTRAPPRGTLVIVVGGFNSAIDKLADVETIHIGAVTRLHHVCTQPGGKGLHVAVACATLGAPAALVGLIDAGSRALFEDTLSACGARFLGVTIDQPIRTCWAIRDGAARVTELLEAGPPISNDHAATL